VVSFAGRIMAYLGKHNKTEQNLFETISKGADHVTAVQVRAWGEVVVNAKKEEVSAALDRADCPRPKARQQLTAEEFPTLYSVYFEALEGATLYQADKEAEPVPMQIGAIVRLSGPMEEGMIPVKEMYGEKTGLVNVEVPGWSRLLPIYVCCGETVFTDAFPMKGFKVVRRAKIGEKVRVLEPLRNDPDTGVVRMKVQALSDSKIGYCTVSKPDGTTFFKPDTLLKDSGDLEPGSKPEGQRCVVGEPIEAMRNDEWLLAHLTSANHASGSVEVMWEDDTKSTILRKNIRCRGTGARVVLSNWNLKDFVMKIIKKGKEDMNRVEIPELKTTDQNGDLLPSQSIKALGEELETQAYESSLILEAVQHYFIEKGRDKVLRDHLIEELPDIISKHNQLQQLLNNFRRQLVDTVETEVSKAKELEFEREEEERKQKEKELEEKAERLCREGTELLESLEAACAEKPDDDADLDDLEQTLKRWETAQTAMNNFFDEQEKNCAEPDCAGLQMDLNTLRRRGNTMSNDALGEAFDMLRLRINEKREEVRAEALKEMRLMMRERHKDAGRAFDAMNPNGNDTLELKALETEFPEMSEHALNIARKYPWPLSRAQFQLAFSNMCRLVGDQGKNELVLNGETVTEVTVDSLMEVLEEDDESIKVRVVSDDDMPEGFLPIQYIRKLSLIFIVLQETVLTDKAELRQLKVVSRIKKNEKVTAMSLPTKTCDLVRMQAKTSSGAVGWISMEGHGVEYVAATYMDA